MAWCAELGSSLRSWVGRRRWAGWAGVACGAGLRDGRGVLGRGRGALLRHAAPAWHPNEYRARWGRGGLGAAYGGAGPVAIGALTPVDCAGWRRQLSAGAHRASDVRHRVMSAFRTLVGCRGHALDPILCSHGWGRRFRSGFHWLLGSRICERQLGAWRGCFWRVRCWLGLVRRGRRFRR